MLSDLYALMHDYYKEENELPEVTVDKLYRLRIEIKKAESHTSFAEKRNNLNTLLELA